MKKKRMSLRIMSFLLVVVMIILMLPLGVFAWSSKTHNYAANLIIDELLENRVQVTKKIDRKTLVSYKYYIDVPPFGKFSVPNEYADAIINYPEAFRAGSLGPDFYPDILTGQGSIHPVLNTEIKDIAVLKVANSGDWLRFMFDKLNSMPADCEEREEGLAFTLGYMFHYCGDMFGHDFINSFVGAEFPSVTDLPREFVHEHDVFDQNLTTILRHMSAEAYMDSLVNEKYTKKECATAFYIMLDKLMSKYYDGASKFSLRYGSLSDMLAVFDGDDENYKILSTDMDNIFQHFVEDTALEAYYCDCNIFDIRLIGDRWAQGVTEGDAFSHYTIDYGSNDVAVMGQDALDRTTSMVGKLDSVLNYIGEDMLGSESYDLSSSSAAVALAEYQKKFYGATGSTPTYVMESSDLLNFDHSILLDLKEKKVFGLDAAPGYYVMSNIGVPKPWDEWYAMVCNLLGMQSREWGGDERNFKDEVDDILRWVASNPMGASEADMQSRLRLNGAIFTDDTFVFPYIMMNSGDAPAAVAVTIFVKTNGKAYALVSNSNDLVLTSDYPNESYLYANKLFIMGRCAIMDSHPGYTRIDAPSKFVAESLYYNGTMHGDLVEPFFNLRTFDDMPPQIDYLIDLRQGVFEWAEEHRYNPIAFGFVAFADRWVADMDRAILGLVDTFDEITQELVMLPEAPRQYNEARRRTWEEDSMFAVVKRNLSEWWSDCGIYALPIPDHWIDIADVFGAIERAIESNSALRRIKEDTGLDNLSQNLSTFKDLIVDQLITWLVEKLTGVNLEEFKARVSNPALNYSPEEFEALKKSFMNFGVSESTFDQECAAFYNTIIMMKLILIGPTNLSKLISNATGLPAEEYEKTDAYKALKLIETTPKANRLMVTVKTADELWAGTDSNVYFRIYSGGEELSAWNIDASLQDDMERGDRDTYFFSITDNIPVEDVSFKIQMDSNHLGKLSDWKCQYVEVTPYNGDIPVGPMKRFTLNKWFDESGESSSTYKLSKPGSPYNSYTTNVGDHLMGLVGFIDKLDGSRQWIDDDNLLYSNIDIRQKVFFKALKGFDPIIEIYEPEYDFGTMEVAYRVKVTPRMNGLTADLRHDDNSALRINNGYIIAIDQKTKQRSESGLELAKDGKSYVTTFRLYMKGKPGELQKLDFIFEERSDEANNAGTVINHNYFIGGRWFESSFSGRFPYGDHEITVRNTGTERGKVSLYFENDKYNALSAPDYNKYINAGQSTTLTIHANYDSRIDDDNTYAPVLVIADKETGKVCQRIPVLPHKVLVADDSESYVSTVNGKSVGNVDVVTVKCGDAVTLNAINVNEYTGEGIDYGWQLKFDRVSILADNDARRSFLSDSIGQKTYTLSFDETGIYELNYVRRTPGSTGKAVTQNVIIVNVTDDVSADIKNVNVVFDDSKEYYSYSKPEPKVSVNGEYVNISRLEIAGRPFAEYVDSVYRTTVKYGLKKDEYSITPNKTRLEVYGYYDGAYTKFNITFEAATFTVLDAYESDVMDLSDLGLKFVWTTVDDLFRQEDVPEFYKLESGSFGFGFADIETGEKYYGKIPTRMLEISDIHEWNEYFVMLMDDEGKLSFYATDEQLCQKYGYQHIDKHLQYFESTGSYGDGRLDIPVSSSGIYRVAVIRKPTVYTTGIYERTPVGGHTEITVNYEYIDNLNWLMEYTGNTERHYFSHWTIPEGVEVVEGDMYSERIVIVMPDVLSLEIGMSTKFSATVSFDANEGTGEMVSAEISGTSEYILPENSFTAPEGYFFAGWRVQYDNTGRIYQPGDTIDVAMDLHVYPYWEAGRKIDSFQTRSSAEAFVPVTDRTVEGRSSLSNFNDTILPINFADFEIVGDFDNDNCWYVMDGEELVYLSGLSDSLTFLPDTVYALKLCLQTDGVTRLFDAEYTDGFMFCGVAASSMEIDGDTAYVTWVFPRTQQIFTGELSINGELRQRNILEAVVTNTNGNPLNFNYRWWVDDESGPLVGDFGRWGYEQTLPLTANTIGQTIHCRVTCTGMAGFIEFETTEVVEAASTGDVPTGIYVEYDLYQGALVYGLTSDMEIVSKQDKEEGQDFDMFSRYTVDGSSPADWNAPVALRPGTYYIRYRSDMGLPPSQAVKLKIKQNFVIVVEYLIEDYSSDGEYTNYANNRHDNVWRNVAGEYGKMTFNGIYDELNQDMFYGYYDTIDDVSQFISIYEGDTVTIHYEDSPYATTSPVGVESYSQEHFPVHLAAWESEEGYLIEIVDKNTVRITMPVFDEISPPDLYEFDPFYTTYGLPCMVYAKFDRCNAHFEDRDMCFDYEDLNNYNTLTEYHYGTCEDCGKTIYAGHIGGMLGDVGNCTECGHAFGYVEHDCNEFRKLVPGWSDESGHRYVCTFCNEIVRDYYYNDHFAHFGGVDTVCGHGRVCMICGFEYTEPTIEHDFSTAGHNDTVHWMECSSCGEVDPASVTEHVAGTAATCTHRAVCADCGAEFGELSETHTGGVATCSQRAVCDICGEEYGRLLPHIYANGDMEHDETHHWEICDICGAPGEMAAHEDGSATCTEKAICAFCGAEYGEYAPHIGGTATCTELAVCDECGNEYGDFKHEHGAYQTHDDAQHKQVCTECGDIHYEDHIWNSGVVTTEAAIGVSGEITYTCIMCSETKTESIPAINTLVTLESAGYAVNGKSLEVSLYIAGTYDGYSFTVSAPDGLRITSVVTASNSIIASQRNGRWLITVMPGLNRVNAEKEQVATITFEVAEDYAQSNILISLDDIAISDTHGDPQHFVELRAANVRITDHIEGDVNDDGIFNYFDVAKLYAYVMGADVYDEERLEYIDISGDGVLGYFDVSDLFLIYCAQ